MFTPHDGGTVTVHYDFAVVPETATAEEPSDEAAGERVQMSFWMNYNFSEAVNELVREQVQAWADENNVEIDILIAPDADLDTRWSAGLEAPRSAPTRLFVTPSGSRYFPR